MPKTELAINPNRVRVVIGGISYWREPEKVSASPSKRVGPMRIFMGEILREERQAQGKYLRDIDGISYGHVSDIERGIKEPSSEVLEMFCNNLDMDMVDVLRRTADRIESARN